MDGSAYGTAIRVYKNQWKNKGEITMRKKERSIIISCIMVIVLIVCLFSDTVFHPGEVYGYTEKTGIVNVQSGSVLNIRDGVGTSETNVIGSLGSGVTVVITDEAYATDGVLWYQIKYGSGIGYVSSAFIKDVKDKVDYTEGVDFEEYMNVQGFPESYKASLRELHEKYPKWVFIADHLDYEWEDALLNQSKVGRSLITKDAISSWKSLDTGSYDWNNSTWYTFDGGKWCAASKELVAYYMDPRNFLDDTHIWMFEKLSYQMDFQTIELLENILKGSFMEAGTNLLINDATGLESNYADILMLAAEKSGVSPFHLAASILVEQGNQGTGGCISGTIQGYEGYYNYYNWKAYAHSGRNPVTNGLIYASGTDEAYMRPWNTRYKSIIGGAVMLGDGYINIGQDTLYYKKFDYVGTPYTHQYMTHVRAPEIEAEKTAKAYTTEVKENTSIVFKIPVFKNMPETAAIMPTGDGNPNNCLSSLSVNEQNLTPTFDKFTTEYSLVVDNSITSVEINATSILETTVVTGTGVYELNEGANSIVITATSENGVARHYTITVVRKSINEGTEDDSQGSESSPDDSTQGDSSVEESTEETDSTTETTTPPPLDPFVFETTLITNSDTGRLNGIPIGSTVQDVISKVSVSGGTFEITDSEGNIKGEGSIVTGDKVIGKDTTGAIICSYDIVVYGDVNGDGNVSIKDLLVIRKHILGASALDGIFLEAGNVNRDENQISIKDVLVLRKYILGASGINQE